jgi:hypothetical protein
MQNLSEQAVVKQEEQSVEEQSAEQMLSEQEQKVEKQSVEGQLQTQKFMLKQQISELQDGNSSKTIICDTSDMPGQLISDHNCCDQIKEFLGSLKCLSNNSGTIKDSPGVYPVFDLTSCNLQITQSGCKKFIQNLRTGGGVRIKGDLPMGCSTTRVFVPIENITYVFLCLHKNVDSSDGGKGSSWDGKSSSWDSKGSHWDGKGSHWNGKSSNWDGKGSHWDEGSHWDGKGSHWNGKSSSWDGKGSHWDVKSSSWYSKGSSKGDSSGKSCNWYSKGGDWNRRK